VIKVLKRVSGGRGGGGRGGGGGEGQHGWEGWEGWEGGGAGGAVAAELGAWNTGQVLRESVARIRECILIRQRDLRGFWINYRFMWKNI